MAIDYTTPRAVTGLQANMLPHLRPAMAGTNQPANQPPPALDDSQQQPTLEDIMNTPAPGAAQPAPTQVDYSFMKFGAPSSDVAITNDHMKPQFKTPQNWLSREQLADHATNIMQLNPEMSPLQQMMAVATGAARGNEAYSSDAAKQHMAGLMRQQMQRKGDNEWTQQPELSNYFENNMGVKLGDQQNMQDALTKFRVGE